MLSRKQLMSVIQLQTEISKLGLDLGSVMQLVVDRLITIIDAEGAVIELVEGNQMVYRATSGIAQAQLGLRLRKNNSLSGYCIRSGKTVVCEDSETDHRVDRKACQRIGLRSMIALPLKHGDAVVGVLKAMSVDTNRFTEDDAELLQQLSEVIGATMFFATKYGKETLFYRATHDELTGLANRSLFMDRLQNLVHQNVRTPRSFGILILDMDGLKQINDVFGHRVGDVFLMEFAKRLDNFTRKTDTAARLGGDEFGVLLPSISNQTDLDVTIQRFYETLNTPFSHEEKTFHLHASVGGALFPVDGSNLEQLLDLADRRMYRIKEEHRAENISAFH
ncbi:sensor domain-containing diguanylate cyclase [Leeia oryzae]|uniref:sensor domain-containing diguanylate cyclase n=1 Tax=Leeia oryzae TaxID=356662 RepID=UPI00037196B4|nr:sensor domain-containing diguanylate cyclase [Leeia oryzae]